MAVPAVKLNLEAQKALVQLAKLRKVSVEQAASEAVLEALELARLEGDLNQYPEGARGISERQALDIASEAVAAVRKGKR